MVIYGIYEVVLIDGSVKCHTLCPNTYANEEENSALLSLIIHSLSYEVRILAELGR